MPLPAAWLSKSRLVQLFEDTISFELTDDAVVDKILSLQPAELGIKAFKNTQSIAHGVDGRKNTLAIERTRRLRCHSEEFLRRMLCCEPAESHCACERQPGLKSNAHVFERNHVATRVEPGNRVASHMNYLGVAGGDQTDGISTERIQLETEERRF